MKNTIKNIALLFLTSVSFIACDSSADSITPTIIPVSKEFLFINSPNAHISNQCNIWDLETQSPGPTLTNNRTDNFSPDLLTQITVNNQCSAYCKDIIQGSKRYVVSTGERVVVYEVSSGLSPVPHVFMIPNVQAMEFVNGRFFMVIGYDLKEYDVFTMTPITAFSTISLIPTAGVSNLTFDGNFLYAIASNKLYKIDTTASGSLVAGYPKTISAAQYNGLEFIHTLGGLDKLFVVRTNPSTTNDFVEIDPATGTETTQITGLTYPSDGSRISSALDYSTEYYYICSSDGNTSGQTTFTPIDLTPATSVIVASAPYNIVNYTFGLQIKD